MINKIFESGGIQYATKKATHYVFSTRANPHTFTGIIKGDTAGNFMPKATTSAQEAAGYGMATREAAVLMSVRSYEKVPSIETASPVPNQPSSGNTSPSSSSP
ncbi:MAG: hypothetical protein PHD40_00620 [Syntrophomonadaceae bacterium]|nr:hypothetical protein [Syntrophomonadaceae bacterium]